MAPALTLPRLKASLVASAGTIVFGMVALGMLIDRSFGG